MVKQIYNESLRKQLGYDKLKVGDQSMLLRELGSLTELPDQKVGDVSFVLFHGGLGHDLASDKLKTPFERGLTFPRFEFIDGLKMRR